MPESIEVETRELHEAVQEIHEEREREKEREKKDHAELRWTRFISLVTAFLAVFAAIGSLKAGALVNEGMLQQIKSSDTWSEYQADKLKAIIYSTQIDSRRDSGASSPDAAQRIKTYQSEVDKEKGKLDGLSDKATDYGKEAEEDIARHEKFASSVALIQVAIALAAVAALTKTRPVWYGSLGVGAIGIALFVYGYLAR